MHRADFKRQLADATAEMDVLKLSTLYPLAHRAARTSAEAQEIRDRIETALAQPEARVRAKATWPQRGGEDLSVVLVVDGDIAEMGAYARLALLTSETLARSGQRRCIRANPSAARMVRSDISGVQVDTAAIAEPSTLAAMLALWEPGSLEHLGTALGALASAERL